MEKIIEIPLEEYIHLLEYKLLAMKNEIKFTNRNTTLRIIMEDLEEKIAKGKKLLDS